MSPKKYSCVEEIEKVVHLSLPAFYTSNINLGVTDLLESWNSKYNTKFDGIVVGYRDVSFVGTTGTLLVDQFWVHYDIKAIFSVFKPESGKILRATINRISQQHIGCLVHGGINVSIYISDEIAEDVAKFVAIGNDVLFNITHVDTRRKVIQVRGSITADCIRLMSKSKFRKKNTHIIFSECDAVNEKEETDSNRNSEVMQSSRKKKVSKSIDLNSLDNETPEVDLNRDATKQSSKGKKRKRNSLSANDNLTDDIFSVLQQSTSNSISGHKAKKLRRESRDSSTMSEADHSNDSKESDSIKTFGNSINSHETILANYVDEMLEKCDISSSLSEASSKKKTTNKLKKKKLKQDKSKKDKSKKFKDKLKNKDRKKSKKEKKKKKEK